MESDMFVVENIEVMVRHWLCERKTLNRMKQAVIINSQKLLKEIWSYVMKFNNRPKFMLIKHLILTCKHLFTDLYT